MDKKLVDADRLLSEHFTAALGGKAQRYGPFVEGGESAPEFAIMTAAKAINYPRHLAVEGVLRELTDKSRRVLLLVYAHGTDATSDDVEADGKPVAGPPVGLVADSRGRLRQSLQPTTGHGSYLRLAVGHDRALRKFARRHPKKEPTFHAVLDFLAAEADIAVDEKKGKPSAEMLAQIRNECEEERRVALTEFVEVYKVQATAARQRKDGALAAERRSAEKRLEDARRARKTGRLPSCLRDLVDEKRDRLRAAALAIVGEVGEA